MIDPFIVNITPITARIAYIILIEFTKKGIILPAFIKASAIDDLRFSDFWSNCSIISSSLLNTFITF